MIETGTWQWVDTRGAITSKFTLVRFGAGALTAGLETASFSAGEALIETPIQQRYETTRGPVFDDPRAPSSVRLTFHDAKGAEWIFFNGEPFALATEGVSSPDLYITSGEQVGAVWTLHATAGQVTVPDGAAQLGPPPDVRAEQRRRRIAAAEAALEAAMRDENGEILRLSVLRAIREAREDGLRAGRRRKGAASKP